LTVLLFVELFGLIGFDGSLGALFGFGLKLVF